ncbi:MAG: pyridoxal phosphate-dependent aminotransferase [Acidobacteriales bacterium]|nr:pyridoxal phosphate-dependent aminotransferase [Terriglobales bacterium]
MFASRTAWNLTPNRLAQAIEAHQRSGRKLLDLTASNPTTVGIHYDEAAILRSLSSRQALEYSPQAKGLPLARQAVDGYYQVRGDAAPRGDRLVVTASTSEGYSYAFRLLCEPGDEILVPAPSYPLFDYLAAIQDVRAVAYPLFYDHGWHIDIHSLEKAITPRTRAIVLVNPNNPTGSYVADSAKQEINELCASRELALIVDEVFLDYHHSGAARPSFVANSKVLTFTLSGLSKIVGLPQMKLAWIAVTGPEDLAREAMARLEVIADTYLSVGTPVQVAAPELLEMRHSVQSQILKRIGQNLATLDAQIARQKRCTRLEIEGGWYAVLRVPVTGSDDDLALSLLERSSILVHPGHFFDFQQDGYLVLSLIAPPEDFAAGIAKVLVS